MSVLALEEINTTQCSTLDLLESIQEGLLPHAETIDYLVPSTRRSLHDRRYLVGGDNIFVGVALDLGHMTVHYSSHHPSSYVSKETSPLELTLAFYDTYDGLVPQPLKQPGSLAVATSSAHSPRHQIYVPRQWQDGGWSLELTGQETGPSLDQGTIGRLAAFASELADTKLILLKERP